MRSSVFVAALLWLTSAHADDAPMRGTETRSAEQAAKENPLWSTPLPSLTATRERPLFSPSRRPPPAAPIAPDPTPVAARPPPPPPAVAETSPFSLIGTVVSTNVRFAVLLDKTSSTVTRLREGQSEQGWTARKVDRRTVLLAKNGSEETLELPKSTDPPPDADAAPTAEADTQPPQPHP